MEHREWRMHPNLPVFVLRLIFVCVVVSSAAKKQKALLAEPRVVNEMSKKRKKKQSFYTKTSKQKMLQNILHKMLQKILHKMFGISCRTRFRR